MNTLSRISLAIALAAGLCLGGCGEQIPSQKRPPAADGDHGDDHVDHGHDHAAQHAAGGPHGGHIIELSHDHSFHALSLIHI